MATFRPVRLLTIGLVFGLSAVSFAACGAQEQLDEARQIVGEALIGEQTQTPAPVTVDAPTTEPQEGTPTETSPTVNAPTAVTPDTPTPSSPLNTYYQDSDGDGFGDPGTTQETAAPSSGWIADNNDCDDTDASVNPDAADSLDADSIDSNCDGLDGDISRAIFVDAAAGDDSAAGTPVAPVQTIGAGLAAASAGGNSHVYVAGGVYEEQVTLVDSISIWGGFSAGETWSRQGTNVTEIAYSIPSSPMIAISGEDISGTTVVGDLLIRTSSAPEEASNYAIHCHVSTGLVLERNVIIAGNGGAGINGLS